MEKVVTSEISKFLIILFLAVTGLSVWMSRVTATIAGGLKFFQKKTLIYLLVSLSVFCMVTLAESFNAFTELRTSFIFLQVCFLLLGILNIYCMQQFLHWEKPEKSFRVYLLFTIISALLGSIGFLVVYHFLHRNKMEYCMLASVLFFIIPFFFYYTFKRSIDIPPKVLQRWYYPINEEIAEPEERQLKNMLVISFQFQKQAGNKHFTNFRAKAPIDMEFGKLFYYFINDYNDSHPDDKIQVVDNNGMALPWVFYQKPVWYSLKTHYKIAGKTIFLNKIRENDVIICTRL